MLELRHLRMLREIARTGSFSAAARNLGYTQPAISQQMRALERTYGTPLVVRSGRAVVFTEAGAELTRHATMILDGVAAAEEAVASIAGLEAGRVRLVVFPSGSATLVPKAAASVRRAHPDIQLSLTEAEPPQSIDLVRSGECDIAVTFAYPEESDECTELVRVPLFADPLIALLPAGHPLAAKESIALTDLADEPWIGGCPRCRGHLVQSCAAAGFEPDIAFATDDNLAVQSLVAEGLGVAVAPSLLLAAARHPGVVDRPLSPPMYREISVFTWPELLRVPTISVTIEALQGAAHLSGMNHNPTAL